VLDPLIFKQFNLSRTHLNSYW